jgi:4-hydroxybenzoate polyprenyltransferase
MDEGGVAEGEGTNGIAIGPEGRKVIARKSNGSRVWTSFIECISATGKACPPLVIFKGQSVQQQWFKSLEGYDNWEFTATKNGWTDNVVALEWLQKIFIPSTAPKDPKQWRLLVVDGHKSHATLDFMWECFSNKIYVVYLPPHTSHVLQPLDVGVFSSLKAAYRREAGQLNLHTDGTITGKQLFLFCYQRARSEALTTKNICSGWRGTGLWPINMAKPLMSGLLVENTTKKTTTPKIDIATRKRRFELLTPVPLIVEKEVLSTPRASRELRALVSVYDHGSHSAATQRLLFRKVEKGYDEID